MSSVHEAVLLAVSVNAQSVRIRLSGSHLLPDQQIDGKVIDLKHFVQFGLTCFVGYLDCFLNVIFLWELEGFSALD